MAKLLPIAGRVQVESLTGARVHRAAQNLPACLQAKRLQLTDSLRESAEDLHDSQSALFQGGLTPSLNRHVEALAASFASFPIGGRCEPCASTTLTAQATLL